MGSGAQSALPVFSRVVRKMNSDKALRQYVDGDFRISEEIREMLACQDFSERKGLRINARPVHKVPSEDKYSPTARDKKNETGVKKFFNKVFGKKDKRK